MKSLPMRFVGVMLVVCSNTDPYVHENRSSHNKQ